MSKLYIYRDEHSRTLEPYYSAHVSAMTSEDLHSKHDIAQELAGRDREIEQLKKALHIEQEKNLRSQKNESRFYKKNNAFITHVKRG